MTNNSLSIHSESGDIFCQNDHTRKDFYNLLLARQDKKTPFIPKRISYRNGFE